MSNRTEPNIARAAGAWHGARVSLLDAQDLHKAYGSRAILAGVTFAIAENERIGLLGANGTGKSTLGRILAGEETPDQGTLAFRKDATFAYLTQEPVFDENESAADTVLAGLGPWHEAKRNFERLAQASVTDRSSAVSEAFEAAQHRLEQLGGWSLEHEALTLLDHLKVNDPNRIMRGRSGGEKRRVAIARLLISKPDLAILDEPTNHLDIETINWLEDYLDKSFPGALLLITHDRYFLNRVATRTVELERGKIYSFDGGYEEYLEQKATREELAQRTEKNRQNFLRRELDWLRRTPAARTGKQKARITRAEGALAQKGPEAQRAISVSATATRTGHTIMSAERLEVAVAGRTLLEGLTFALKKGDRVGIVGPNGAGKTSLLRVLLGQAEPKSGTVTLGANTQLAYLDQVRSGLDDQRTVYENVAGIDSKVELENRQADIRSFLEKMMFDTHAQMQPVGSLSGGEKARVLVAKLLRQTSNLLVLDEPTNDLDVGTLSAIEQMLIDFDGTALIVTHDRWFLDRVATAILAFDGGTEVTWYEGNYSTYQTLLAERVKAKAAASAPPKSSASKPTQKSDAPGKPSETKKTKSALSYAERIELGEIVEKIELAENAVKLAEAELADPDLFANRGNEVPQKTKALEDAQTKLAALLKRWEALELKQG